MVRGQINKLLIQLLDKMKKLVPQDLVHKFNELRMNNRNEKFTAQGLQDLLKQNGFNEDLIYFMKKQNIFNVEKVQKSSQKIYRFKDEPLYCKRMEKLINDWRQTVNKSYKRIKAEMPLTPQECISEEEMLKSLKSKGYQIQKCVGFDESKFAKEHPDLYKQYLIYECIWSNSDCS